MEAFTLSSAEIQVHMHSPNIEGTKLSMACKNKADVINSSKMLVMSVY